MTETLDILLRLAPEALGRRLTDSEAVLFVKYLKTLLKWQRTQRLVGSDDVGWIQRNLFAEALLFSRFVGADARRLLDLGSGAGLPGVPLKIVRQELDVVLLEARQKRASFLKAVVRELALRGLHVDGRRAEGAVDLAGGFDVVVARCAGDPHTLVPVALRLLRSGGLLALSGPPDPKPVSGLTWQALDIPDLGLRHFGLVRNT